jgi:hypothetical protein
MSTSCFYSAAYHTLPHADIVKRSQVITTEQVEALVDDRCPVLQFHYECEGGHSVVVDTQFRVGATHTLCRQGELSCARMIATDDLLALAVTGISSVVLCYTIRPGSTVQLRWVGDTIIDAESTFLTPGSVPSSCTLVTVANAPGMTLPALEQFIRINTLA